jgi:hypothetical protein
VSVLRDDLAAFIREVDANNKLGPAQVSAAVAGFLHDRGLVADEATENGIDDFAYDFNSGASYMQPMSPEALADAIIAEFNLNEVAR